MVGACREFQDGSRALAAQCDVRGDRNDWIFSSLARDDECPRRDENRAATAGTALLHRGYDRQGIVRLVIRSGAETGDVELGVGHARRQQEVHE